MTATAELLPSLSTLEQAHARLRRIVHATPLEAAASLSADAGAPVWLKLECWQRTRSFKLRGAYNAIASLTAEQRARGIVTASAGNHGQAVALAARELDARATVFVPADAPAIKQRRIRAFGAELRTDASDYDAAEVLAARHAADTGATFVHAFSDPAVVAGQGTVGLEIVSALPLVDTVVVPVGGGGLIAGVGAAVKALLPGVRVVGVQSTETRAMYEAFAAGRVVDVDIPPTLADGLAGCTDERAYAMARSVVDELVLVGEADIAAAIRALYEECGVVAEGAGAVGVAAVRSGAVELHGSTAVIVSGGNIDALRLSALLRGEPWQ